MDITDFSPTLHTDAANLIACRDFYTSNLGASVTFECDWYITVIFGKGKNFFISFMVPQEEGALLYKGGATLNIEVDDVDAEYQKLISKGMDIPTPPEDKPWGCRAFEITDPVGTTLYIFTTIPMADEYASAIK